MRRSSDTTRIRLSIDQVHARRLNDWKMRRVFRLVQSRQQANKHADCLKERFWKEARSIAHALDAAKSEELQILEELNRRRLEAEEQKRENERLQLIEREEQEETLKADRTRIAEFYEERAQDRQKKALVDQRSQRQAEQAQKSEVPTRLKEQRRMEDQLACIRREHYRQSKLPVQIDQIPTVRRDSLIPRGGIPQPTPFVTVSPGNALNLSPVSAAPSENRQPSGLNTFQKIAEELIIEEENLSMSVGSLVSLDKENMEPVLDSTDEREDNRPRPGRQSIISRESDSFRSQDSEVFRRILRQHACELSPPKTRHVHRYPADDSRRSPRKLPIRKSPASSPRKSVPHALPFIPRSTRRSPLISGKDAKPATEGHDDVMTNLRSVMDALNLLDHQLAELGLDSSGISVSSGPLSLSEDSWLSQQILSLSSSFQSSGLTAETGTIFSCVSLAPSGLDWSVVSQNSVSAFSQGSLAD